MTDSSDPESSVGYITLGVFAQSIAERLSEAAISDVSSLQSGLDEAISALERVKDRRYEEVETTAGLRPFQDYDQVTALYEVLARDDPGVGIDNMVAFLKQMRDDPEHFEQQRRDRIIRFFDALAIEALQLSRRPPEGIPSGVRDLCLQR